jgi:alanyl-tRNA synthetase
MRQISSKLSIPIENSFDRVNNLLTENEKNIKEIKDLQAKSAFKEYKEKREGKLKENHGIKILVTTVNNSTGEGLLSITDDFGKNEDSRIIAIGTVDPWTQKPIGRIVVSNDLVKKYNISASCLAKEAGSITGGGGGGTVNSAQFGGTDSTMLDDAMKKIDEEIDKKIN